jgi:uncharacterized protein (TIGR03000 family)
MLQIVFKRLAILAVVGVVLGIQHAQAGSLDRCSNGSCGLTSGDSVLAPTSLKALPVTHPNAPSAPSIENSITHPIDSPSPKIAVLSVKVPANATVFVNGSPTLNKGTDREYICRNLQSGKHYNFTVRVEYIRNGQSVMQNQTVQLVAGQSATLDFTQGATWPRGPEL